MLSAVLEIHLPASYAKDKRIEADTRVHFLLPQSVLLEFHKRREARKGREEKV
jgi:hypothetical protein